MYSSRWNCDRGVASAARRRMDLAPRARISSAPSPTRCFSSSSHAYAVSAPPCGPASSRRWRGLWTGLTELTFRSLEPARIEATLAAHLAASTTAVSTLDICLETRYTADLASSLLRAAARVSPRELVFTSSVNWSDWGDIKLPCFDRTTSIELQSRVFSVDVAPPFAGEFTSLERLSLAGYIIHLGVLLNRCPRLCVLSLNSPGKYDMSITLPPNSVFPMLDSLSLTGEIDGIGNLLNLCRQRLRALSVTYPKSEQLTLPPTGKFLALEKMSLSGNICDPGTLLNRCPCLRVLSVTFYGMALASLKTALATLEEAAPVGLTLSRLGISIPWRDSIDAACFASLLHMAARQSPKEFIVTDDFDGCDLNMRCGRRINADLPCFRHATSIEMNLQIVCFTSLSTTDEFLALERLTLLGRCSAIDVGTLVTRCPRLRVLEINLARVNITVHSASLQKLKVYTDNHMECHDIDIVTLLKQLQMVIVRSVTDTNVSISAPLLEKVKWQRCYTEFHLAFGSWRLGNISVEAIEKSGIDNGEHVLRLHLYALNHLDREFNFAQEMEKLPVTKLSVLELQFGWACHVYGALVSRLLRMHRIRSATKKLELFLDTTHKARKGCHGNSPCHKPKNWRSQSVFYTCLEEVKIIGFTGEDHEHDFLTMIFKCSPMLKKVTVTLAETIRGCTTKLSNIFSAYPSVNCNGHFRSGELFPRVSG